LRRRRFSTARPVRVRIRRRNPWRRFRFRREVGRSVSFTEGIIRADECPVKVENACVFLGYTLQYCLPANDVDMWITCEQPANF